MFEGMFDDAEDQATIQYEEIRGALPDYYKRRAQNCANNMDLPP